MPPFVTTTFSVIAIVMVLYVVFYMNELTAISFMVETAATSEKRAVHAEKMLSDCQLRGRAMEDLIKRELAEVMKTDNATLSSLQLI